MWPFVLVPGARHHFHARSDVGGNTFFAILPTLQIGVEIARPGGHWSTLPGVDAMILKIFFAEKFSENFCVFCSNYCQFLQKL
jgi:hypothetical protein